MGKVGCLRTGEEGGLYTARCGVARRLMHMFYFVLIRVDHCSRAWAITTDLYRRCRSIQLPIPLHRAVAVANILRDEVNAHGM